MKQYLNEKQMEILQKEVEIKDNMLCIINDGKRSDLLLQDNNTSIIVSICKKVTFTPTLTIGELLERLPEEINGFARVIYGNRISYIKEYKTMTDCLCFYDRHEELIDNLFKCYLWYLKIK